MKYYESIVQVGPKYVATNGADFKTHDTYQEAEEWLEKKSRRILHDEYFQIRKVANHE